MDEKMTGILGTLGVILLGVIASVIAWALGPKDLPAAKKEIVRQMLNFQITILIVSLVLCWIPIVGALVCLVVWVANIYYAIVSFMAYEKGNTIKIPAIELIK